MPKQQKRTETTTIHPVSQEYCSSCRDWWYYFRELFKADYVQSLHIRRCQGSPSVINTMHRPFDAAIEKTIQFRTGRSSLELAVPSHKNFSKAKQNSLAEKSI